MSHRNLSLATSFYFEFTLNDKQKSLVRKTVVISAVKDDYARAKFDSHEQYDKLGSYLNGDTKSMTCPRCHKEQPESPECIYCGIVPFQAFQKER